MDSILRRYCSKNLPIDERARLKCLPESLTIGQIAGLWVNDRAKRGRVGRAIQQACIDGHLECTGNPRPRYEERIAYSDPKWRGTPGDRPKYIGNLCDGLAAEIHRDAFKSWLIEMEEWPLPENSLLANWFPLPIEYQEESATIQEARTLLPKIKELWRLVLAGNDNPLKMMTADNLQECALDILRDKPKKWLPIKEEHLKTPSLYNTAPDRAAPIFRRNLLKVVLESQGFSVRNIKQLLKDAKAIL